MQVGAIVNQFPCYRRRVGMGMSSVSFYKRRHNEPTANSPRMLFPNSYIAKTYLIISLRTADTRPSDTRTK